MYTNIYFCTGLCQNILLQFRSFLIPGVNGEVTEPLEAQCRPYVEEALKKLETGEPVTQGTYQLRNNSSANTKNLPIFPPRPWNTFITAFFV